MNLTAVKSVSNPLCQIRWGQALFAVFATHSVPASALNKRRHLSIVRKISDVGFQRAVFNSQTGSLFRPHILIVRLPRACLVGERVWEPDRAYPESLFSSLLAASGGQQV